MNNTKHSFRLAALAGFLIAAVSLGAADAGPWSVRLRATYLSMADKSDAFTALSINFPSNAVHVNSKLIPEFDVSYAFTSQFSAELVLTIPQTQDVTLQGVGKLGTFNHLPPTLLAQYHFIAPSAAFQPYVGAGLNYTLIWGTNLSVAGVPLALEHNSLGLALQAGCDYDLGNNQFLNLDVKYVGLQSDVKAGGARLTTAKLDPWLFSLGYGWRF
jgi:outer membrane protein